MKEMEKTARPGSIVMLILAACLVLAAALSLGARFITPGELLQLFQGHGDPMVRAMVMELRVPRILMALAAGAALSTGGTVFQAMLRNPLADPFIVGVSGGAALGATAVILFLPPGVPVVAGAFAGSLGATFLVFSLSRRLSLGSETLILAGVAISFSLSSMVFLMYAFGRSSDVHRAVMWMMGDLSLGRYEMVLPGAVMVGALIAGLFFFHRHLDIISFGESFSRNLGIGGKSLGAIFWIAALLVALPVAMAGIIGFVGLMVPHITRSLWGGRHGRLIPLSACTGALFLLAADTAGRSIAVPYEIPVGVITGLVGGIFFVVMLFRRRQ